MKTNSMRYVIATICAALAGCSTITPVQPLGEGRYMIGATSGINGHTKTKITAIQRANKYCRDRGRQMVVQTTSSSGAYGVTSVGGEIIFRCDAVPQEEVTSATAE